MMHLPLFIKWIIKKKASRAPTPSPLRRAVSCNCRRTQTETVRPFTSKNYLVNIDTTASYEVIEQTAKENISNLNLVWFQTRENDVLPVFFRLTWRLLLPVWAAELQTWTWEIGAIVSLLSSKMIKSKYTRAKHHYCMTARSNKIKIMNKK